VAIVLSPDAKKAWNSANSQTFHFGDRILAIRMHIPDEKKRLVKIFFVVAYFPIGAASPSMRQEWVPDLMLELESSVRSVSNTAIKQDKNCTTVVLLSAFALQLHSSRSRNIKPG